MEEWEKDFENYLLDKCINFEEKLDIAIEALDTAIKDYEAPCGKPQDQVYEYLKEAMEKITCPINRTV